MIRKTEPLRSYALRIFAILAGRDAMAHSFGKLIESLPPERQKKIADRTAELIRDLERKSARGGNRRAARRSRPTR